MHACLRPYCPWPALAEWWLLCAEHTSPLLTLERVPVQGEADQQMAAGWDALGWAERIAPDCWGNALESDPWVVSVRCLVMASVVTSRALGCAHTVSSTAAAPVVAMPRVPGVLRCPPCAEPAVAQATVMGPSCDRCGSVAVIPPERVAALTGASVILVAYLCRGCRAKVFALAGDVGQA